MAGRAHQESRGTQAQAEHQAQVAQVVGLAPQVRQASLVQVVGLAPQVHQASLVQVVGLASVVGQVYQDSVGQVYQAIQDRASRVGVVRSVLASLLEDSRVKCW